MSKRPHLAPGPRGHFVWGSLFDLMRESLPLLVKTSRQYGDVVRFRSAGPFFDWHLISHPEDIQRVLETDRAAYYKGFLNNRFRLLFGDGLLTLEGDVWRTRRRLAQPAFHRARLAKMTDAMVEESVFAVRDWPAAVRSGEPLDIMPAMLRLTLRNVGRNFFSVDFEPKMDALEHARDAAVENVNYVFLARQVAKLGRLPTARMRKFYSALGVIEGVLDDIIVQRRREAEEGHPGNDLLTMMMEARDAETGGGLTDREIRNEMFTLMGAGQETTAGALCWSWYLISQNPEAEARLHDEVDRVLHGRLPTAADVPNLIYTKMIFEESMRLYPPIAGMARQPREDMVIRGCRIRAHSPVVMAQYVTHRHPEFWDRPDEFDPERFSPDAVTKRPRYAYFPFGGGARQCIGASFAMTESIVVLATIAQRYRMRLAPGHTVGMRTGITLLPLNGLPMIVTAR